MEIRETEKLRFGKSVAWNFGYSEISDIRPVSSIILLRALNVWTADAFDFQFAAAQLEECSKFKYNF